GILVYLGLRLRARAPHPGTCIVRGRNGVSAGLAQPGADTVRTAHRGQPRYRHRAGCWHFAAWGTEVDARSRWRPRLGLRAADPTGPRARHHEFRSLLAGIGPGFPFARVEPCRRRCGECPRARVSRARPSETHDAPGTSAPHANDWIAGKRDCA